MNNLIIVGTGGFAIEVYEYAKNSVGYGYEFELKGFIEGNIPCDHKRYIHLPAKVFGNCIDYVIEDNDVFVIAMADFKYKEEVAEIIFAKGGKFINLIHNTAVVSENATLGKGIILCPFVTVTSNAVIEDFVMFNCYSLIAHGARIGKFSSVMSHVAINGNVLVGHHTFFGSGAKTVPGCKIGNYAKVGASSLVIRKAKEKMTVFGVPAQPI